MRKRLALRITGEVQGVFYRDFVRRNAVRLGIRGYVRNMPDRSVEAVLEGDEEVLKEALRRCWEGPTISSVKDVDEEWSDSKDEFYEFSVKH
jgi:acylphosphatase